MKRIDILSKALNLSTELDALFYKRESLEDSTLEIRNKDQIIALIDSDIDLKISELDKLSSISKPKKLVLLPSCP